MIGKTSKFHRILVISRRDLESLRENATTIIKLIGTTKYDGERRAFSKGLVCPLCRHSPDII